MDVHTCRCIWSIAMSGWIQNSKWIQIIFENKFEKGAEIKEKENWKIKEFKRVVKFIFGSLLKFANSYWNWKVYLKLYLNLNWIWFWKQNKKEFRKWKTLSPLNLAHGPAGLLSHPVAHSTPARFPFCRLRPEGLLRLPAIARLIPSSLP